MNKINSQAEYLSLKKASELCDYSQMYLSLRARQGKLQATKIGRNWVTTKEWLNEYVESADLYKNSNGLKTSRRSLTQFKDELLERPFRQSSFSEPPENGRGTG